MKKSYVTVYILTQPELTDIGANRLDIVRTSSTSCTTRWVGRILDIGAERCSLFLWLNEQKQVNYYQLFVIEEEQSLFLKVQEKYKCEFLGCCIGCILQVCAAHSEPAGTIPINSPTGAATFRIGYTSSVNSRGWCWRLGRTLTAI